MGTGAVRNTAHSACQTVSISPRPTSSWRHSMRLWRAFRKSIISRCWALSSSAASSKPIEKVRSGALLSWWMTLVRIDESSPPER